jgi:hypothetical protein
MQHHDGVAFEAAADLTVRERRAVRQLDQLVGGSFAVDVH